MEEFYSRLETYYSRWIAPLLAQASRDHPVVILTGARQVGKSTLLLNEEPFRRLGEKIQAMPWMMATG